MKCHVFLGLIAMVSLGCSTFETQNMRPGGAVEIVNSYAYSGYDALKSDGQRKVVGSSALRPEGQILRSADREVLSGNAYDLYRNSVLLSWALRRHMDYICSWEWRPNTGDKALDTDLRDLHERDARPYSCDVGGRHSWSRMLRLAELQAQLAGDCLLVPLQDGLIQGVESHHWRNPTSNRKDMSFWQQGCKLGPGNRTLAVCLHEALNIGGTRERIIPRSQVWHHGCFDFRFDQIRGISPVTTAMNGIRDTHETIDDIRSKLKMEAILGVAFFQADEQRNPFQQTPQSPQPTDAAGKTPPPYFDIGKGAVGFMMGDRTKESIESFQMTNPSTQTQEFLKLSIMIAIKAFDLPFFMFDESNGNFVSSRGAWLAYEKACVSKMDNIRELNRLYTLWRTARWALPKSAGGTGEITLPRSIPFDWIQGKWIARGTPWWKPEEEITTDLMLVACGAMTLQEMCDKRGFGIWEDNIQDLAKELDIARQLGCALVFNQGKLPVSLSFLKDAKPQPTAPVAAV